jgi:hypothetical protein
LDVRNKHGADLGSDHYLVEAKVQLNIAVIKKNDTKHDKRFKVHTFDESRVKDAFHCNQNENCPKIYVQCSASHKKKTEQILSKITFKRQNVVSSLVLDLAQHYDCSCEKF